MFRSMKPSGAAAERRWPTKFIKNSLNYQRTHSTIQSLVGASVTVFNTLWTRHCENYNSNIRTATTARLEAKNDVRSISFPNSKTVLTRRPNWNQQSHTRVKVMYCENSNNNNNNKNSPSCLYTNLWLF